MVNYPISSSVTSAPDYVTDSMRSKRAHVSKQAHVIVCGNEKGGAGKTTTAMHILVGLLLKGFSVASIDLDCYQQSFTRYISNRQAWLDKKGYDLPMPKHFNVEQITNEDSRSRTEQAEFEQLALKLSAIENEFDFVVIDTPGYHNYMTRIAHALADTLVTPINESFIDLDLFGKFQSDELNLLELGQYVKMVMDGRNQRKQLDGKPIDWVVVRNRVGHLTSRNHVNIFNALEFLSSELNFRLASGISERNIYREFFPLGITALDKFTQETVGTKPSMSHLTARREVRSLLQSLQLPNYSSDWSSSKMRLRGEADYEAPKSTIDSMF